MDERVKDLLDRGRQHYAVAEYVEAEKCLAPLARDGHPFADVYGMLGVISYLGGRIKDAKEMLQHAVLINPGYTEAALHLSVVLNDAGDYSAAKDVHKRMMSSRKIPASAPGDLDVFVKSKIANMHAEVGAAYEQSNLPSEAAHEFARALVLCPTFVDIRIKLGMALRAAGDNDGSIRELERAKREHPRLPAPRLQLGMTYYSIGRHEDAAREWREVLTLDEGNRFARMYLALAESKGKIEPAAK
jgi:tetratricopeptide (TPR) repeat protein